MGSLWKGKLLDFRLVKHFLKILRRSEVTINLTRRLKKMGASEFAPLWYYIVLFYLFFSDAPSPCGHMQFAPILTRTNMLFPKNHFWLDLQYYHVYFCFFLLNWLIIYIFIHRGVAFFLFSFLLFSVNYSSTFHLKYWLSKGKIYLENDFTLKNKRACRNF